ncbi:MAG: hypothetical protein GY915_06600 [bacterium]|nr:hypothetical protein [bacterium]
MLSRFIVLGFLLAAFLTSPTSAKKLKMHGSATVTASLIWRHAKKIEKKAGHKLTIITSDSLQGIKDLVAGDADIAMISVPLSNLFEKAEAEDVAVFKKSDLREHKIGKARVAFAVHKDNPVKTINFDQIAGVLEGRITNWKELGGVDEVISVVLGKRGGGIRTVAQKKLIGKTRISAARHEVVRAADIPKIVSVASNALGIMPERLIKDSLDQLKTDGDIEQPLTLVTKGPPSAAMKKIIKAVKSFS